MTKKPSKLPRGYKAVTPSLAVFDIASAVDFYASAFGAKTAFLDDEATPSFAVIKIDAAPVFLTLGWPGMGHLPQVPGTPRATSQHLYVENVDELFAQSVDAGAISISEPVDAYWGERTAIVTDPFGHYWTLATRIEILTADELKARREAALGQNITPAVDAEENASPEVLEGQEEPLSKAMS